jgi:hypothetical protein
MDAFVDPYFYIDPADFPGADQYSLTFSPTIENNPTSNGSRPHRRCWTAGPNLGERRLLGWWRRRKTA